MRNWKSYSMAFAFVALCTTSVAGCDVSQIVADIIAGALGGNGGCIGGCASGCASCNCASCSCASCASCTDCGCAGCEIDCSPDIRDLNGKNQGFNGSGIAGQQNTHNGRRIANAVQVRLTSSGYTFLQAQVPSLITGVLGTGGIALPGSLGAGGASPGKLYLELRQFTLSAADNVCNGNAQNNLGNNHDCIRATLNAYFRTCDNTGGCTAAETVNITVSGVPILGSLTCALNLDAGRGTFANGLPIRADVGTIGEAGTAAFPSRNGDSRLAIFDAEVTNVNALEGADVQVSCPNQGPFSSVTAAALAIGGAVVNGLNVSCNCPCSGIGCVACVATGWYCTLDPNGIVTSSMAALRADLNDIVDAQLQQNAPKLCQSALAAIDCPSGSTYAAPASGAVSATNPGSCTINGSAPARCVEILLGAQARIGLGSALAVVSPGIEATLDFFAALQNEAITNMAGTNANISLGLESWVAGIRGLRHNPCVPIEHPAASAADCTALGSGYEYEGVLQDGTTNQGRCVPRIPLIPIATGLQANDPPIYDQQSDDMNYEVGVGISESFASYAAWKLWDSGALCLSVGSWLDPQLSPSLLSFALFPPETNPRLFFPLAVNSDDPHYSSTNAGKSSVALSLHPQTPPIIAFDQVADPCDATDNVLAIDVTWDALQIDLSIWSNDRYARAGTIETDLHLVVNLDVGAQTAAGSCPAIAAGALAVAVPTIEFGNAHWLSDAPLLGPADFRVGEYNGGLLPVQAGFNTVGGFAGSIVSGLVKPIDVETLINTALMAPIAGIGTLPIRVNIDHDAFQIFEQNGPASGPPYDTGVRGAGTVPYNFLGVFVDLTDTAGNIYLTGAVDTAVIVTNVTRPDDRSLYSPQSANFGQGELPTVEIAMSATGPADAEYEYIYRTSYTGWSDWQRSPYAIISDPALLVQGEMQVFARARVVGAPESVDETSATATFVIDVTPPMIQVYEHGSGQQLQALDLVSNELEYRVQEPGDDFGDWTALPGTGIQNVDVEDGSVFEVRDEEGNVGSTAQSLQGRPNAANSSACASCATAGSQTNTPPLAILGGLLAFGAVVSRRRRRS